MYKVNQLVIDFRDKSHRKQLFMLYATLNSIARQTPLAELERERFKSDLVSCLALLAHADTTDELKIVQNRLVDLFILRASYPVYTLPTWTTKGLVIKPNLPESIRHFRYIPDTFSDNYIVASQYLCRWSEAMQGYERLWETTYANAI